MITGAIFDCDGTLIDSMWLWERVFFELADSRGTAVSAEQFAEAEPLSADGKCRWLHERMGIGSSAAELVEDMRARVRKAYAHRVSAWPGVAAFLGELRAAGIPMIVASSTHADDVGFALAAHGLDGFFEGIVFAGDTGRSKEHPDVYLEACRRLGTERASTWVFEDAPFALRSARSAGFPTVCVLNDHDGRDPALCRESCDILVRRYDELSLERLRSWGNAHD